jgi:hypothetical protein
MTRIVSFDVGIKNMAYCIFDVSGDSFNIHDWNVLNLMNPEPETKLCNIPLEQKKKSKKHGIKHENATIQICNKKAKYEKGEHCYCEKHAKMSDFLIPTKECSPTQLKKLKLEKLNEVIQKYKIPLDPGMNKTNTLNTINVFMTEHTLKSISSIKTSAGELDLITIGKNLKNELNQLNTMKHITHVVIENQISPIATRMKTIQGMLAQYYIMAYDSISIDFVSSSCKLKGLEKQNTDTTDNTYQQHKKDAVYHCKQILEKRQITEWMHVLDTKKRDDLADCFLQGIWFIQNNKNKLQQE